MAEIRGRPKRAGEDYTRTHHGEADTDGPSSSKKPRFDLRNPSALAPDTMEDDAVLDADEIGHRGQRVRRNAVNIDGYESDSDNEGFGARAEAKAKARANKGRADDEEDMFAELEEDFADVEGDEQAGDKKKTVRFLQDNEIEGQVGNSTGGGTVSIDQIGKGKGKQKEGEDDESESEADEEGRAAFGDEVDKELGAGGKKSHVPLLDAFNMRSEQEEGRFDEAGNYVRKAVDPDAVYDTWLEGVSKKEMRKAKEAAEKREEEQRKTLLAQDSLLTADVLGILIKYLQKGETVLEALARLGKGHKQKPKWQAKRKNRRKNDNNGVKEDVEMEEEDPAEVARKNAIEEMTGAADTLLSRGQTEIYEAERELLTRQYKRETGEDWHDASGADTTAENTTPSTSTLWEYRWSDARDGGETHGPYEGTMMESWNAAGYFGEGVEFRKAGGDGEWTRAAIFV